MIRIKFTHVIVPKPVDDVVLLILGFSDVSFDPVVGKQRSYLGDFAGDGVQVICKLVKR